VKNPLQRQSVSLEMWSIDLVSDVLTNGKKIRTFHVIDGYNWEAIAFEVAHLMFAMRIIGHLDHKIQDLGRPKSMRIESERDFIGKIHYML
jgi:putative transposase